MLGAVEASPSRDQNPSFARKKNARPPPRAASNTNASATRSVAEPLLEPEAPRADAGAAATKGGGCAVPELGGDATFSASELGPGEP